MNKHHPRIFMISYGGAHVSTLIPIYKELEARGIKPTFLALTVASTLLEKAGVTYKRLIDYEQLLPNNYKEIASKILTKHHNNNVPLAESTAYLGSSLSELISSAGIDGAMCLYKRKGLNAFTPSSLLKKILQTEKSDIVITTDSPRMEFASLLAAEELQIPSYCIVPLFPWDSINHLRCQHIYSKTLVINETVRMNLVNEGRRPDSVIVTGSPLLDTALSYDHGKRLELRNARGILDSEKVVLWAEQPYPSDPLLPGEYREFLISSLEQCKDIKILVRPHPSGRCLEDYSFKREIMISDRNESILDAIATADILVTFKSIAAYEALLMNKPAIVTIVNKDIIHGFDPNYGVDIAYSKQEMVTSLLELLAGQSEKAQNLQIKRKDLRKNTTMASQRIVDEILQSL